MIKINFIVTKSIIKTLYTPIGLSILEIAHENNIYDIPGICSGALLCSTCHIVLEDKFYKLANNLFPITIEEKRLLEEIVNLTLTSRLSCQIFTHKGLEGMVVKIPVS